MAQYIDKSAVQVEIERRIKERDSQMKKGSWVSSSYVYEDLLDFLDTLVVKEVNVDEAARKWEDKVYLEKGWQNEYGTPHVPFSEIGNAFKEGARFILQLQKGE